MQILARGAMAEPIRYCLNQWRALNRFVEDGRLHIDNNLAERALRHFAVGRKNWLFFQTEGGGETAVVLASLLQTARAIGIDPKTHFRDVLLRIGSETDVSKLTPHGWKHHFAQDVADHHEDILCRLRDHFANLTAAGITLEALDDLSVQNPGRISRGRIVVEAYGPILTARFDGNLEASLLLLSDFWDVAMRDQVGPNPVAAVPSRDVIVFCSGDSAAGVAELRAVVNRVWPYDLVTNLRDATGRERWANEAYMITAVDIDYLVVRASPGLHRVVEAVLSDMRRFIHAR